MNKKVILTYQLKAVELVKLREKFNSRLFEIKDLKTKEEFSLVRPYAAFIAVNGDEEATQVQELYDSIHEVPVFLTLRTNSFEQLFLATQNKVSNIFMGELNDHDINLCFIKTSLKHNEVNEEIPREKVLELFSSPMNILSNQQLLFVLRNYFNNYISNDSIAIVEFFGSKYDVQGCLPDTLEIDSLLKSEFSRRFIGEIVECRGSGEYTLATPIFEHEGNYQWLVVSLDRTKEKFLFNDLFFRFLENNLIYRKTKENERSLEILAGTDDVTGLLNQRRLSEDLQMAIADHEEKHNTFSIMFIDVDHFKDVNDNHGHLIGSQILTDLGKLLGRILRRSDHIYRYGGDEFVVIMPVIKVGKVHEVATRVLNEIKKFDFPVGNDQVYKMSVSIGLAEYPTDAKSASEIIQFADEMMYKSKESGRGKVFHVNEVDDANTCS